MLSPPATPALSAPQVERYSRQLLLPSLGVRGQAALLASRVLIVGLGGLGSPAALYLAGAGVGTIGLVDRPGEVVETSNLHRQLAHAARVGEAKTASAAAAIAALNPEIVTVVHEAFTAATAPALTKAYDVVLDCTDNVASRYLASDACAASRTPLVSGAAIGTDGQLTVYCLGEDGACLRCVFPSPPPPTCVGSCASAGVLGPVPGTIGTLMALEALKILGVRGGRSLSGRLLVFDGADCVFRNVKLRGRVEGCEGCGGGLDVSCIDYDKFAGGVERKEALPREWRINAGRLKIMRDEGEIVLVDIRPKVQFEMCALDGARSFPIDDLKRDGALMVSLRELVGDGGESDRPVVVLCRSGNKSQDGVRLLRAKGFKNAVDVEGGLQAWHNHIDSSFPLY